MRKRGIVLLLASVPVWTFALIYSWYFEKSKSVGKWYIEDLPMPLILQGAEWVILIVTPLALGFLLIDSISWLRRRNDRTDKPN